MDKKPVTPSGVLIRDLVSGQRIQISFMWNIQQCRELLPPCPVNKASIQYASNLRAEIKRKVTDGSFIYAEYFPESPKAKKPSKQSALMEEMLQKQLELYEKQVANGKMSPATFRGYAKSITGERMREWRGHKLTDVTPSALREWIAIQGRRHDGSIGRQITDRGFEDLPLHACGLGPGVDGLFAWQCVAQLVPRGLKAASPGQSAQHSQELLEAKSEILRLRSQMRRIEEERDILKNGHRTCRTAPLIRNTSKPKLFPLRQNVADRFLEALNPVKKHGPGGAADPTVVVPCGNPV